MRELSTYPKKRKKRLKVEEDIDRELEWNQRNLFEKWLLDALDIEKEQENKDKIFSVLLKLDWKVCGRVEAPLERRKQQLNVEQAEGIQS